MKKGLTELVLVIDRSGSMHDKASDVEGGLQELINEQKKLDGEFRLTLLEFDNILSWKYQNSNLSDYENYKLIPGGSTSLIDAVGVTIREVGARLAKTNEKERPERILFVVITDGEENSSHKYTNKQIKEMVKHQEDVYNWEFIFMGADIDAFHEAGQMGFASINTVNVEGGRMRQAFSTVNAAAKSYRAGGQAVASGNDSLQEMYDKFKDAS